MRPFILDKGVVDCDFLVKGKSVLKTRAAATGHKDAQLKRTFAAALSVSDMIVGACDWTTDIFLALRRF